MSLLGLTSSPGLRKINLRSVTSDKEHETRVKLKTPFSRAKIAWPRNKGFSPIHAVDKIEVLLRTTVPIP